MRVVTESVQTPERPPVQPPEGRLSDGLTALTSRGTSSELLSHGLTISLDVRPSVAPGASAGTVVGQLRKEMNQELRGEKRFHGPDDPSMRQSVGRQTLDEIMEDLAEDIRDIDIDDASATLADVVREELAASGDVFYTFGYTEERPYVEGAEDQDTSPWRESTTFVAVKTKTNGTAAALTAISVSYQGL